MTRRSHWLYSVRPDEPVDWSVPPASDEARLELLVAALSDPTATFALDRVVLAVTGASERTRARLVRTLKATLPSRKLSTNGGLTMSLVTVALGSAQSAAEFDQGWTSFDHVGSDVPDLVIERFAEVISQRGASWLRRVCANRRRYGRFGVWRPPRAGYRLFLKLVEKGVTEADDRDFLEVAAEVENPADGLTSQFWRRFEVEGLGAGRYSRATNEAMDQAIRTAVDDKATRIRLLDCTVAALLRGYSAYNIEWYLHVLTLLAPQPDEILAREEQWVEVLATNPSTAVALSQGLLSTVIDRLRNIDELVRTSRIVLARREIGLRKAQISLLRHLRDIRPEHAGEVSTVLSSINGSISSHLKEAARGTVDTSRTAPRMKTVERVHIPGPRTTGFAFSAPVLDPISNADELAALLRHLLASLGTANEIIRAQQGVVALRAVRPTWSHPLSEIAEKVITARQRERDSHLSLRLHLAQLTRAWLGDGRDPLVHVGMLGWQPNLPVTPAMTPLILPILSLQATTEKLLDRPLSNTDPTSGLDHLLASDVDYQRGWVRDVRGLWVATERRHAATLDTRLIDAATGWDPEINSEWNGELDRLWELLAFYLARQPDLLAAHAHPALRLGVGQPRSYGRSIVSALGASDLKPGPPTLSALALASSARHPDVRSGSAEAIATLATRGLLDPQLFAAQISILASTKVTEDPLGQIPNERMLVMTRVAESLEAAASCGALAGWRVLETLLALLPELERWKGAPNLIDLLVQLAHDYGVAVPLPTDLEARLSGNSALSAALRALSGTRFTVTDLAQDAAREADASLR